MELVVCMRPWACSSHCPQGKATGWHDGVVTASAAVVKGTRGTPGARAGAQSEEGVVTASAAVVKGTRGTLGARAEAVALLRPPFAIGDARPCLNGRDG